ncbi:MAG TPA: hypothetical protein VHU23_07015 [Rhizomicrobium sp.]|nr:hypothetical protein [Rhizomicrobium sp.]
MIAAGLTLRKRRAALVSSSLWIGWSGITVRNHIFFFPAFFPAPGKKGSASFRGADGAASRVSSLSWIGWPGITARNHIFFFPAFFPAPGKESLFSLLAAPPPLGPSAFGRRGIARCLTEDGITEMG